MKLAQPIATVAIALITLSAPAQQYTLEFAFSLKEMPAIIEGMTFDPIDSNFYFGESIHKRLLRYSKDGKSKGYIDAAKDGMTSVLGMSVSRQTHHLWVCGAVNEGETKVMCLFEYDLKNDKLLKRYLDTSRKSQLFNDVTITADENIFTTDSYTRSLYTVDKKRGVATLYMQGDSVRDANGISSNGNIIYVSTSRGFTLVDTKNKNVRKLNLDHFMIAGNDGLYYYKNSLIGIQNVLFPVSVNRFYLDPEEKKVVKGEVMTAGDTSLVVPTTGAFAGDEFFFMSNNNIGTEDPSSPAKVDMKKVKPVTVVRIRLR